MARRWLVGITLAGLVFSGGLAWARPGVLKTRAGLSYDGEIDEKSDSVIVTMHGVQTTVPKEQVASIDYASSFDEQYKERLAKIGEKDAAGRIALARYAFDNRKYPEAEELLQQAIALDPSNSDAQSLLETVRVQARLDATRTPGAPRAADTTQTTPANPIRTAPGVQERPALTPDEINYVRQSELRPTDVNVRINISQELKRKFAIANNVTFAQFNNLKPLDQALEILRKGDDETRKQVRVMTDPGALAFFKSAVQPVILSGCATSGCHGGMGAGNFGLFSPAPTDAASYANFLLLQRYTKSFGETGSVFGGAQRRMIDRGKGSHSILANFSLPPDVSDVDHPPVEGGRYNGIFRGKNDPRYIDLVAWIDALNLPESDYASIRIAGPARAPATTGPSTGPASTPSAK